MPPIVALIIFSVYILPLLGEGPQWNTVVKPIETLCRNNWWKTLLLIQNYWGFENICITHTHYVAVGKNQKKLEEFHKILIFLYFRHSTFHYHTIFGVCDLEIS